MKFGVSTGQTRAKIIKRVNSVSTVLVTVTPRRHTGDCGRRRASTRRPSRLSAALHLADDLEASCLVPSSPSIPILKLVRPESSRVAAVRRVGHGSPPHLDSSHPELRNLAPTPLHSIPCLLESYPGRNRAQTAVRHCCLRQAPPRASPLSSTTTFRPSFAQNESPVSFPAAYSYSPTLSLSESALRRRGIAAAPPRTCWAPPVRAAGAPCSRPRPPTARP